MNGDGGSERLEWMVSTATGLPSPLGLRMSSSDSAEEILDEIENERGREFVSSA